MAHCSNCGGPVELGETPSKCTFCHEFNVPAPKEVMVAVPVQVVHNNVVQAVGSAPMERRCPHCKKRLVTVVAEGVSLSGCGACGGIWVDNASARSVLSNPLSVFADLAHRAAAGASGSRGKIDKPTCAECPAVLDRSRIHGIDLDVCTDHGTWFDARELETLVKLLRHETTPAEDKSSAKNPTIPCQGCGAALAPQRANITDRGLCCDSCWRTEQRELIAASDTQINATGSGAVVGGVLFAVAAVMLGASTSRS
jgi:Zn-finger nucleic acid-binding protein